MEEELLDNEASTEMQPKISPAERLRPWQFQPGVSGNPGGKPKGTVSLKTYAKNMLQNMSDEEKLEFMKGLDKDVVWEMAEGKAQTNIDASVSGEIHVTITKYADKPPV